MGAAGWRELADGVLVHAFVPQRLNIGLVVGAERCVVIDTRSTHVQGQELADAVRRVTDRPWTVVNTHAHWDHCFGNQVFLPADIWGHHRCVDMLEAYGSVQQEIMVAHAIAADEHDLAAAMAAVTIVVPHRTLDTSATIDLGDRSVHLHHLGRGHTDNDVVVEVADADVVFAGDLVEEGDPPEFGDAFPLDWPATLERLLPLATGPVVPGHGAVVDRDFVQEQTALLARTAEAARAAHAAGRSVEDAASDLPLPERAARHAMVRAYRQLDGAPPYDPPAQVRADLGLA